MRCLRRHSWQQRLGRVLQNCGMLGVLISLAMLQGLLFAQPQPAVPDADGDVADIIQVLPQQVRAGTAGQLFIALQFPDGYHLNPRAPLHYSIAVHGEGIHIAEADQMRQMVAPPLPLVIPFQANAGTHQTVASIDMTFYYCREDDTGVCVIQSVRWQLPLQTAPDHTTSLIMVSYTAEVPVLQKRL